MKSNSGIFKANAITNQHEFTKMSPTYEKLIVNLFAKFRHVIMKSYMIQKNKLKTKQKDEFTRSLERQKSWSHFNKSPRDHHQRGDSTDLEEIPHGKYRAPTSPLFPIETQDFDDGIFQAEIIANNLADQEIALMMQEIYLLFIT